MIIRIQTIFLIVFVGDLIAQSDARDYSEELKYQNEAINSLKNEISQLRSKIKTAESRERSASSRISSLDQEISLTSKLIQSLKNEEEKTRANILQIKNSILKSENELDIVRTRYKKRVVNSYLKGRLTDLEKVFSSTTWRSAATTSRDSAYHSEPTALSPSSVIPARTLRRTTAPRRMRTQRSRAWHTTPSTMPIATAIRFFSTPPNSVPMTSVLTKERK